MKRFLLLFLATFLSLTLFTSCKDVNPEFKFKLEITGDVSDAPSSVQGNFSVNVCNDTLSTYNSEYVISAIDIKSIAVPEGEAANDWVDDYIENNVIAEFGAETEYNIVVKGYVHETLTGITFSVDKVFTNL